MTLVDRLTLMFMKQLLATPKGRAHFLTQLADAENNDEGKVFAALQVRAQRDPELARLVARHAADEERHAQLLLERADATGLPRPTVPEHLKILHRLDEALGGFFAKPLDTDEDVMRMYLLLQVIEERAVSQFPMFREGFREHDPVSAAVLEAIESDEERHLKYCEAIARRFAPSREVHERTLRHFREVEARVFAENSMRNLSHTLGNGLLEVGPITRLVWRAIGFVAGLLKPSRPTPFANAPLRPALQAGVA